MLNIAIPARFAVRLTGQSLASNKSPAYHVPIWTALGCSPDKYSMPSYPCLSLALPAEADAAPDDALAPDALTPARGFEAYASEAFARRPSPVGLPPARRNSFGDRATTRAPSVSFDHRRSRHSSAQSLRRQSSRLHHAGRVSPVS